MRLEDFKIRGLFHLMNDVIFIISYLLKTGIQMFERTVYNTSITKNRIKIVHHFLNLDITITFFKLSKII